MNITLIIIKNTAPLDFIFPMLNEMYKNYPDITCNILYCDLSKYRYIRKSKYYTKKFRGLGIKEFDYISFLPKTSLIKQEIFRKVLSKSPKDSNNYLKKLRTIISKLEMRLYSQVNFINIVGSLSPNIILLGNTESKNGPGVKEILETIYNENIQTFLLPHAPHHRDTKIFTPFFKEQGWILPEFCEYWMPFKYDHPWDSLPSFKKQFHYIGYPGLDKDWLEKIKREQTRKSKNKRILFIIRRFTGIDSIEIDSDKTEDFIYNYQEVLGVCLTINDILKKELNNYKVTIKPHPSNDYTSVKKLIKKSKLKHWGITYEPIYDAIGKVDLIISMYSTTHLIPAMAGIPVIIMASSVQTIAEQDPFIKELYRGMQFALNDNLQLSTIIEMLKNDNDISRYILLDKKHIRKYYPDKAIQRSIDRILQYRYLS